MCQIDSFVNFQSKIPLRERERERERGTQEDKFFFFFFFMSQLKVFWTGN